MSAIKRTFFYIRSDTNVPFYHELGNTNYLDDMNRYVQAIDPGLRFEGGIHTDKIHYFCLYHPDHDTFKTVTQNLYFDGELKQEFKKCMRWTKQNRIAFALSASKLHMDVPDHYELEHYWNIKTDQQTFIDATPLQKQALHIYDQLVSKPETYFTVNFFDYNHNVKHVETRLLNTNKTFWLRFYKDCARLYPTFMQDKHQYNQDQGIEHFDEIVKIDHDDNASVYNTQRINKFLPADLQNLKLPIFI